MRTLSAGWLAAAESQVNRPIQLLEAVFGTTIIRLATSTGDVTWSGSQWLGNGWFMPMDGAQETDQFGSETVRINLNGVPSAVSSLALQGAPLGSTARVFLGFLDPDGLVIEEPALITPILLFDYAEIQDSAEGSDVTLIYQTAFLDEEKTREFRWNGESQKLFFPGDVGFQHVENLGIRKIWWGPKPEEPGDKKRRRRRRKNQLGKGSKRKKA